MKLGITKVDCPALARSFGTLICGAGVGMFLAVAFVAKEDRGAFPFSYFVTAWLLVLIGSVLRSATPLLCRKGTAKNAAHEKNVA